MSRFRDLAAKVRERNPEGVAELYEELEMPVLVASPTGFEDTMRALRDDCGFDVLSDLCGVDWLPREPRFDLNYQLYSLAHNDRLRVKLRVGESDPVPSVVGIWPTADFHEREVYDFFGITFAGHPNLTRILMPDEWIGHPLRKDYPVGGVPVEYKIEPAYVGEYVVAPEGRSSAGGLPSRLSRDRGEPSHWTWTGQPAAGVRIPERTEPPQQPPEPPAPPEGDGHPDEARE